MNITTQRVRIDKWLWAARFFKTRQLAVKAIKNSQINQNGNTIKPATNISVDDLLKVKRGLYEIEIRVLGLAEKRGSATIAQTLYEETAQSIASRESLREQLANQPKIDIDSRKPDKRGVRDHREFKRRG